MKTKCLLAGFVLAFATSAHAITNDPAAALQQGLLEEEANRNFDAAIQNYQAVVGQIDKDRKLAATAVFRLGECYRQQGKTNEAAAQYGRVLRDFSDQATLVAMSRQNLATLGSALQTPTVSAGVPIATDEEQKEIRRIQDMIRNSPDLINTLNQGIAAPLHVAANLGQLGVAQFLLDNGADVNLKDSQGRTALHLATAGGHKSMVELMLARNVGVDFRENSGRTALHLAAAHGFTAVAETLLAHKADVNSKDSKEFTPLHLAASAGQTAMIELLVPKGNVNGEDNTGRTPLSYGVQSRSEETVKALLAARADPNAGRSDLPLSRAAYDGNSAILELLLTNGANPNTSAMVDWSVSTWGGSDYPQGSSFTPLLLAIRRQRAEAVRQLLRFKADPNVTDPSGNPLLFRALSDPATLKALLEGGANPNKRDRDGFSSLLRATQNNNQAVVELLLAHGADPKSALENGYTPLHAAVDRGNKPIVELLLKHGADVNARFRADGRESVTPLHRAVQGGAQDLVELLLAHGADPNVRNSYDQTPLDLTKQVEEPKRTEIQALLRQHGALEDLPHLDRIEVRRPSANYSAVLFYKSTNDWNRFTLLELVALRYGILTTYAGEEARSDRVMHERRPLRPDVWADRATGNRMGEANSRVFPDFAHVVIRHPTPDGKGWDERKVDLAAVLQSGDCRRDVPLEWGDVVEIPETDHPINETWQGLSDEVLATLKKCLTRQVEIVVKKQSKKYTVTPDITIENGKSVRLISNAPFMLVPVLYDSKLLLASSDLSRVKVTRRDPDTSKTRQWVLDCRNPKSPPAFWLHDGDVIEVPEKP